MSEQPIASGRTTRATTRATSGTKVVQRDEYASPLASPTSSRSSRNPSTSPMDTRVHGAASSSTTSGSEERDLEEPRSKPARKEKAKRSRVSPEQLVRLEELFLHDKSPTAARRKDISSTLGMLERQTQIWFQNRRAKAKVQEHKRRQQACSSPKPVHLVAPSALATSTNFYALVGETEQSTFISCQELAIGTWRRSLSHAGNSDLIAYTSAPRRSLNWFVQSAGSAFKMEVPYDAIVGSQLVHSAPNIARVSLVLSRPPEFFLQSDRNSWKKCADWTEDHQATKVLQQVVVGNASQLVQLVNELQRETVTNEGGVVARPVGTPIAEPKLLQAATSPIPTLPPSAAASKTPVYPQPPISVATTPYPEPEPEVYSEFVHPYDHYASGNPAQATPRHSVPQTFYSPSPPLGQTREGNGYQQQQVQTQRSVFAPVATPISRLPSPPLLTTPFHPTQQQTPYGAMSYPSPHSTSYLSQTSAASYSQESTNGLGGYDGYNDQVYDQAVYGTEAADVPYPHHAVYADEHGHYDAHGYYMH